MRFRAVLVLFLSVLGLTSVSAAQCVATGGAGSVTICTPLDGATVSSPVSVQAAALPPSGQVITAMRLYVDDVANTTVSSASLSTSVSLTSGTHRLVVNAWTNTGAVFSARSTITVSGGGGGGCTPVAGVVTICSPASGSTVNSPVNFSAVAGAPSGQTITAMKLYVDSVAKFQTSSGTLTTSQSLTSGSHNITVNAWTNTGAVLSARETITVAGSGPCTASGTDNSITVCSPTPNSTVGTPTRIQAAVKSTAPVKFMQIYVDNVKKWEAPNVSSVDTSLTLATGKRYLVVQAYNGAYIKSTPMYINVTDSGSGGVSVSITPTSKTIVINQTQQFTASVQNATNTAVTWSVDGIVGGNGTVGTISTSGLYTAPGAAGNHTVTATSVQSPTAKASAAVSVVTSVPPPPAGGTGVFTYQYDNGRSGLYSHETKLTPANVNSSTFGKKGQWSLDGASNTQPLYVPGVTIGGIKYNVLYVATQNNSVYALNADVPGKVLWKRNFHVNGATVGRGYAGGRTSLGGYVGITGTPVIDPDNNLIYVVTKTTENDQQVYRLRSIDIRSGNPVDATVIQGSVAGTGGGSVNGRIEFNALWHNQRPALLLSNGVVYVTFAAYSDHPPYQGWVFAYDASSLTRLAIYNAAPNSEGAGIWLSGAGPSADPNGNVYVITANEMPYSSGFPALPTDIPNSVVKLGGGSLALKDYFTPYNTKCLTNKDLDLGSTSATVIPESINGKYLLAFASKEGRAYLVDRNNMGKYNSGSDSQIVASTLFNPYACDQAGFNADTPMRVYGAPAYWNGYLYFASVFGPLRQYDIRNGTFNLKAKSSHIFAGSGQNGRAAMVTVSSNGDSNGIVWSVERDLNGAGWLRAYSATDVSKQLYSSNYGSGRNFNIATVANGRVYVSGGSTVYVYGLLN